MSAVLSSARPNRSPRSFRAWLAFCTALVTLSAAECSILLPAEKGSSKVVKQGDQQEAGSEAKQSGEKRKEGGEETLVTLVKRQNLGHYMWCNQHPWPIALMMPDKVIKKQNGLQLVQSGRVANEFSSELILFTVISEKVWSPVMRKKTRKTLQLSGVSEVGWVHCVAWCGNNHLI